jgi:photosystem II stability/assembly factor-like uncharacterized protein
MRPLTLLLIAIVFVGLALRPAEAVLRWEAQPVPTSGGITPILYAVTAASPEVAWAAGSRGRVNEALFTHVLKTTDGGQTWSVVHSPDECCEVVAISAASTSVVWAVRGGDILQTADGGSTWSVQYRGSIPLWSVAAASERVAWAVGTGGRILVTSDGGATWVERVAHTSFPHWPTDATLWSVAAVDANVGYAVGDSGLIVKTTDGGATWVIQASVLGTVVYTERFLAVDAASSAVAWAVGINGALFKTEDGGVSWFRQYPPTADYTGMAAASASQIWLVAGVEGGVQRIAATVDGGRTWSTQYLDNVSSDRRIGAIAAASPSDVWAVSTGQILKLVDPTGLLRTHLPLVVNP